MPFPTRYRTTNWSSCNAALRERGSLSVWFDPDMVWHAEERGKGGRHQTFADAAIQTCPTLKVLFGIPFRQTAGLVESLIRMAGPDWPVPDCSTSLQAAGADRCTDSVSRIRATAEPADR